jgi:hypothetical protein
VVLEIWKYVQVQKQWRFESASKPQQY